MIPRKGGWWSWRLFLYLVSNHRRGFGDGVLTSTMGRQILDERVATGERSCCMCLRVGAVGTDMATLKGGWRSGGFVSGRGGMLMLLVLVCAAGKCYCTNVLCVSFVCCRCSSHCYTL